ncbi:hypothetical protein BKA65DRAFT_42181 [Rhexocercosporidium sp. MPI-PUGE-AT-0058]|nr:hypothetical protein BKA65DRAFT_42181 [Rhexocercosporidium sp. MPI-PUGE-AT-0058]
MVSHTCDHVVTGMRDHTFTTQNQKFSSNSKQLSLADSYNSEHIATISSNSLDASFEFDDPWTVDWTDSSSLPTSWDYDLHAFEDFSFLPAGPFEGEAESCPKPSSSSTVGSVSNLCVLPSDVDNFLGNHDDRSRPRNQFNKHNLIPDHSPTPSQSLELDLQIPSSGLSAHMSTSDSSVINQGSHFNFCGSSPQSMDSSPRSSSTSTTTTTTTKITTTIQKPANKIDCTWSSCNKSFPTRTKYNHHSKSHTRPFQCHLCPQRYATKRHLNRHINDVHEFSERYYCSVVGCSRSEDGGGKHFSRMDLCSGHMRNRHADGGGMMECVMNEQTRRVRRERKMGKRREI